MQPLPPTPDITIQLELIKAIATLLTLVVTTFGAYMLARLQSSQKELRAETKGQTATIDDTHKIVNSGAAKVKAELDLAYQKIRALEEYISEIHLSSKTSAAFERGKQSAQVPPSSEAAA